LYFGILLTLTLSFWYQTTNGARKQRPKIARKFLDAFLGAFRFLSDIIFTLSEE
jgi:hypothetical protein